MAASMARHNRNFRSGRLRSRYDSGEEKISLDFSLEPSENLKTVLIHIVKQKGVSKAKKVGYLNSFIRVINSCDVKELGLSLENIFLCLRLGFLHEAKEVRAATLRVIRHLICDEDSIHALTKLHIDYFIARSLDLVLDNEVERIQGIKLIRKICLISHEKFPASLLFPLIAVGNDGAHERDRLLRICIATICELAIYNVKVVVQCGGVGALLNFVLHCHQYSRIAEAIVSTLLHLINKPEARKELGPHVDLQELIAPLTERHFQSVGDAQDQNFGDDKDSIRYASQVALVTILRSWSGIIHLCHPNGSALKSLIGSLYLPYSNIRKGILEFLFEMFRLRLPAKTKDFSHALLSVDPAEMQDAWHMSEDFVVGEGLSLLPNLARTRPDLVESHLAVLISIFTSAGLIDAIVEVIATSEGELFIWAVLLLGELLHMGNKLLPAGCIQHGQCLPTLIALASSSQISNAQQQQATLAILYLERFHAMKKRQVRPCSLFFDQLLQHYVSPDSIHFHTLKPQTGNLYDAYFTKAIGEDMVFDAVRDTQVVITKDNQHWDWDLISAILQWPDERLQRLEDQSYSRFIRRLVYYFKPSNHLFSDLQLKHICAREISLAGCHLVDFLLRSDQSEGQKYIIDWLIDIAECLREVLTVLSSNLPPEAVFSIPHISSALSQMYFVFIGRFSASKRGERYLEQTSVFQALLDLVDDNISETYVKLAVSCLDYKRDGTARIILSKALTSSNQAGRSYCTRLLGVLLRMHCPTLHHWIMETLVTQLYDTNNSIKTETLNVLEEACETEELLLTLIKQQPSLLHLGTQGIFLQSRFLSSSKGFKYLKDSNYLETFVEEWVKEYHLKYVEIVDEILSEAFSSYERNQDGLYSRRAMKIEPKTEALLPVHLYGQLSQNPEGFELLKSQDCVSKCFDLICDPVVQTTKEILEVKAALWSVGHIGSSRLGIAWLQEEGLVPEMIRIAEECPVFSIRGTAYYALGLLASTRFGVDALLEYGWESYQGKRELLIDQDTRKRSAINLNRLSIRSANSFSFDTETRSLLSQSPSSLHPPSLNSLVINGSFKRNRPVSSVISSGSDLSLSPKLGGLSRSRTLPLESGNFRRYQTLPVGKYSSERQTGRVEPKIEITAAEDIEPPLSFEVNAEECDTGKQDNSDSVDADHSPVSKKLTDSNANDSVGFEEKGSDSDSSKISKSRTESFNTDSTTSGISSCESVPQITVETKMLTPIPSVTSIDSMSTKDKNDDIVIHPSVELRKLANLTRVPSLRRKTTESHISLTHIDSPPKDVNWADSLQSLIGYETLRNIKRQRTYSSDMESDVGISTLFDEGFSGLSRAVSMESNRSFESCAPFNRLPDDASIASLPEYDPTLNMNLQGGRAAKTSETHAEYIGLAMPVDINLILEWDTDVRNKNTDHKHSNSNKLDVNRNFETTPTSSKHNKAACVLCCRQVTDDPLTGSDQTESQVNTSEETPNILLDKDSRSRLASLSEAESTTAGSMTSTTSADSVIKKMNDESKEGKHLIRLEVLRFAINLSSSVGVKSAEQGLLNLKQKFPKAFRDLCFYSDVCHLLATCGYRLAPRRFLQELFEELDYRQCLEEGQSILGIQDEASAVSSVIKDNQENFVEFAS